MNRRGFLGACLLAACHHATPARLHGKRPPDPSPPEPGWREAIPRVPPYQGARRRIAVHGDRLAVSTDSNLQLWDLDRVQRVTTLPFTPCVACFLLDGRLAAIPDDHATSPELHLIDPRGNVDTRSGPRFACAWDSWMVPATDGLYVSHVHGATAVYDLAGDGFAERGSIPVADNANLAGLADGRLVAWRSRAIALHAIGAPPIVLALADSIDHLVVGPDGAAWVSLVGAEEVHPHAVIALPLVAPPVERLRIDVAPARVWDLAVSSAGVGMLLDDDAGRALAVFDDRGRERWRTVIESIAPKHDPRERDYHAYLAMADHRVAVLRGDGALDVWDVTTGASVGRAETTRRG